MTKWETFIESARSANGEWVAYDGQIKNRRSANSMAHQMRQRFGHEGIEIKASAGSIVARKCEVSQ